MRAVYRVAVLLTILVSALFITAAGLASLYPETFQSRVMKHERKQRLHKATPNGVASAPRHSKDAERPK